MFANAFLAAVVAASQPSPVPAEPVDEITVTATRREVDISDVSLAISARSRDAMLGEKLATDALDTLVGVSLQQTTPGQGAAIIRGLKGSAILHLVDGMRLNNAMFRTAPTPWFALVPNAAVERVEVVRGTPASLYGSEAVGGVVQAVSRLPVFDSESLSHGGEFVASLDTAELQKSIRATLDVGNRRLASSLSVEYLHTGDRQVGDGERIGPSGYEARAVRAVVRGTPDEQRAWYLDFHFLEQPNTPRVDELVAGFGQTEPASSEFSFSPNRRMFAHFQHEFFAGVADLDWKFDAAWQRIDDDRTTRDLDAVARRLEDNRSDLYGVTLNASGARESLSWIAGFDVYYDRVGSRRVEQELATGTSTILAPRFPDGATITQGGVFGNFEWQPASDQALSLGLRFSEVRIELPDGTSIRPGQLSGDIGWLYDASESLQLVANFGVGFRAPNIADLGTLGNRPGNRFNVPNTALGAEDVTHGDLGLRLRNERIRAELVLFALRYDDRIVSVSTGEVTPEGRDIVRSVNAASSTLHGVEGAVNVDLAAGWRAAATLSYVRGEQDAGSGDEPADRVPPLHARLVVNYELNDRWSFESWLTAASGQDRLSARDVRDVRIDPNGTPGWATLGGATTWTDQEWQIVFGVDNVLDRRYRRHGSGLDAPGRNVFLTARRRW